MSSHVMCASMFLCKFVCVCPVINKESGTEKASWQRQDLVDACLSSNSRHTNRLHRLMILKKKKFFDY
jgi:hypothetical protein